MCDSTPCPCNLTSEAAEREWRRGLMVACSLAGWAAGMATMAILGWLFGW